MQKCVMIAGLGDLGGWVLELLARSHGIDKIVTADKRENWGRSKTECAAVGSSQQGFRKTIEFRKLDFYDVDQTAEILLSVQPDVIYTAATLQSWWAPQYLPEDFRLKSTQAGGGPYLPLQLALPYKLMLAVKKSGLSTIVLNHSFPDVVNVVLWKNGLGPAVGAGNTDLIVERIRWKLSHSEKIPREEIIVYFFSAHQIAMNGPEVPHYIKIIISGQDVTKKFDTNKLISDYPDLDVTGTNLGNLNQSHIAASAVKNIVAMVNDTNELSHAPGPNGLPGGYPVRLCANGPEVVLPEGLSLEDAIKINNAALKFDGIEEIKENGIVVCTEKAKQLIHDILGYSVKEFKIEEVDGIAKEMLNSYRKIAKKYNAPYSSY